MAFDFDEVKDTVKAISVRLDSPSSRYNLIFSESNEAVEVRVEDAYDNAVFIFVVDADRFRVVKALEIDPKGYSAFNYHSCVELLSYILEYFYPVFYKLNSGASIMDMLSRVLGEKVRIWKDLVCVICKSGNVEYYDFGHTVSVLGVNFSYNLEGRSLNITGDLNESLRCTTVMELVTALLTYLSYLFRRDELEVNPILKEQLVDEDFDFDDLAGDMQMGEDIDAAGGGGLGGGGGGDMGEDLSEEFEPAEGGVTNTAPDIDSGKTEILDDVFEGK